MDLMRWSLKLPWKVSGITIRLHLFLLIFLAVELLSFTFKSHSPYGLALFLATEAAFLGIILLHELGHCHAARSVGGRAEEVLLWPLGGLAYVHAPNTPEAQMKTAIGGPSVNIIIGLFLGLVLLLFKVPMLINFDRWYYLRMEESIFAYWLQRVFILNTIILLFNLLPAFPLDGGRILQCYLWRKIGFGPATLKTIRFGNIGALGLVIIGLFAEWFLLVFIAFFIYMEGQRTKFLLSEGALVDESVFGHDFSDGYTSLESTAPQAKSAKPGPLKRWAEKRKEKRQKREEEEWEDVQRRVDDLLAKVSEHGLHSLSNAERQFLRRASKRYEDK